MTNEKIPKDWKIEKLGNLFDVTEQDEILELINLNNWKQLRIYLNSKSEKLNKKGILADYLYYFLEAKFRYTQK